MTRRERWMLLGAAAVVAALVTPIALRQMAFFRVRRVEVVGARFLAPPRIAEALGLEQDQNLFDPVGEAERRVEAVPEIGRAHV